MTLIAIVDPREMEAELMVSKKDIFKINRNTSVDVYVDGVRSAGWVKRTSPEAQTGSGLYPVVVGLPEKSGILPGSYLEGRFLVDHQPGVKAGDELIVSGSRVLYEGAAITRDAPGGAQKM